MDKTSKKKIKELKKEGKYNQIFEEFGSDTYKKYTPSKIQDEEVIKLCREGKYEDIFNKYGEEAYNDILFYAQYNEIKEAKGKFKAWLWKTTQKLKFYSTLFLASSASLVAGTSLSISYATKYKIEQNKEEYAEEIEDYDNKITEYAENINKMNLSDVQIFMKVMNDMWNNIQGYGIPKKDLAGFYELDLATEEGYGVCRNMASDVAKKLQKINSEYNARTKVVRMSKEGYYILADVDQVILDNDGLVYLGNNENDYESTRVYNDEDYIITKEKDNKNNEEKGNIFNELAEKASEKAHDISKDLKENIKEGAKDVVYKVLGNHMVTLVDIPEDNLTLVIDPTNPGLGIYKDGKITMLNSDFELGIKYETRSYFDAVTIKGGFDGFTKNAQDYIKSFRKPNINEDEIREKYGIQAQNSALEEVRKMDLNRNNYFKNKYTVEPMIKEENSTEDNEENIENKKELDNQER